MKNKIYSIVILLLIYLFTIITGLFGYKLLPDWNVLLKIFLFDVFCTLIIWIFSVIFKNSSIYDPYWSIMPMIIVPLYMIKITELNLQTYVMLILVEVWGVRLTYNCLMNFKNLKVEDWRYQNLREKGKKWWPLINLFGVHLMPTITVYLALLPILYYLEVSTVVAFNLSTIMGLIIMAGGILLELVADQQMRRFKKNNRNPFAINCTGLWGRSRHPNYLGEIMFWWGGYLMMLSLESNQFILLLGPLVVTASFCNDKYSYDGKKTTFNKK